MLTYKIMFLKEKTHWERHKILLQVKDCPQATWLQPLAWTRLKSVLPANTQELELCSQTVQSSQWEQHSWWINLNSYHGGMGRQAGVLALWAFLSFLLTMGGKAIQTPAGYESSPEGICPSHGLQLGLFACLLFWELPDMLWFLRQWYMWNAEESQEFFSQRDCGF